MRRLKAAGIKVVSVIPTVEHARRMEAEGVDAIVASGAEAGGHVGTVSTLPLVPQVVDAVKIPVLAAGGIGDARGLLAAFALGAVGIQMGTRFMATRESDLNDWGRERLLAMRETDTIVTRAMTGATVRCIRTPEIAAYEEAVARGADAAELKDLATRVRTSRYGEDKSDRRQSAAGQVAAQRSVMPRPMGMMLTPNGRLVRARTPVMSARSFWSVPPKVGSTPSPPASLTAATSSTPPPPCMAPCRIGYLIPSRSQMTVWNTSAGLGAGDTTQRTRDEVVQADI